ncbi:MAG: hypothetical protein MUF25_11430 [Pirellulaceae bacterium]|jgi:hypothetical protein|nr:hypothetical protein [Pirellulaceae bacterium]
MQKRIVLAFAAMLLTQTTEADQFQYKERLVATLLKQVPAMVQSCDPQTGRFGSGIWICQDQERMYPLAVAYGCAAAGNRYHKDKHLLDVIMKAGDALIADMDASGQWEFRKKDGSTWGPIWMPWTYSRWVRTFALIRDDMPPERRDAWTKALTLGYTGIARSALGHVHNIPAHHAMGLYAAGKALDRPEWCRQAAEFLLKVAAHQTEGGYWSEGGGPVVLYDFVYLDAIGTYYAMSGDQRMLPCLEQGARFHWQFTYPDGRSVETIDQRNPYHDTVSLGNVGFTFTPIGRVYLQRQWSHRGWENLDVDLIASLLLYGEEGSLDEVGATQSKEPFVLTEGGTDRAAVARTGPWFVCLSAYTTPVVDSRWIQDRQNFVSVYHDKTGLILGGGNTKLQPAWSNFTVGDPALLAHTSGDTNPVFRPPANLQHVPSAAVLSVKPELGLDLTYAPESCRVRVVPKDERTLEYRVTATTTAGLPVAAHVTLIPHLGKPLETAAGQKTTLGEQPISWTPQQLGDWVAHGGYRLRLPPSASLYWPALPHNPYRKDGHSTASEGRIELRVTFDGQHQEHCVTIEVLP